MKSVEDYISSGILEAYVLGSYRTTRDFGSGTNGII
jgi:hypothetical protein